MPSNMEKTQLEILSTLKVIAAFQHETGLILETMAKALTELKGVSGSKPAHKRGA